MNVLINSLRESILDLQHFLLTGDHNYFVHINQEWTNSWFDSFMPFVTDFHRTWFYLTFVAAYVVYKKRAAALGILLGCIVTVALSDVTAARLIKPAVQRARPEVAEKKVRLLVPSQKSPGFPSNHATNMFAAAFFFLFTFPPVGIVGLPLAFIVAYSRVYVGVHYPLDVMGGALLGLLCAMLVYRFYLLIDELLDPIPNQPIRPRAWKKKKFS